MKNIDDLKAVNDIDDKFIEEAAPMEKTEGAEFKVEESRKKIVNFRKWGAIAAGVVLVAGIAAVAIINPFAKSDKDEVSSDRKANKTVAMNDMDTEKAGEDKVAENSAEKADDSKAAVEESLPGDGAEASDRSMEKESEAGSTKTSEFGKLIGESELAYEPDPGFYDDASSEEVYKSTKDVEVPEEDMSDIDIDDPYYPIENNAEALLLTAGRWNDNANWGFFLNLVNSDLISFPRYGLEPVNRIAVKLVDEDGNPIKGCVIEAYYNGGADADTPIWTSRTNKNGYAYVFCYDTENAKNVTVVAYDSSKSEKIADGSVEIASNDDSGQNGAEKEKNLVAVNSEIELKASAKSAENNGMQVMFIIDTTGSMGDEITYLQKDFAKIVEDVDVENIAYSVNFYRDTSDNYVTKCNPFSTDIKDIQKKLNDEYAGGGGDFPEAVAQILTETMNSGEWKDDCAKVAFLVFDAPPHDGTDAEILAAVKLAAAKGIHLVPVVASQADRDTELFGRALAIMTDGEYVFLTDDSGIGDSHLEPIIGDYEVQKLHDVIVDIIEEYK